MRLLVLERAIADGTEPGAARRQATLEDALSVSGPVDRWHLLGVSSGPRSRLLGVLSAPPVSCSGDGPTICVVSALNAPHVLAWAIRGLHGIEHVCVDLCDGALRTLGAHLRARRWRRAVWALVVAAVVIALPKRFAVSYISQADARSDRWLHRGRVVLVEGPTAPQELGELPPFAGPPTRLVVPADLNSYHNRVAFGWLMELVKKEPLGIPIEIFGPIADLGDLPPGVAARGWAPSLAQVYEGDTAVFAPNIDGAGILNKVWEAICAGRPVLVGQRAAGPLRDSALVFTYESQDELPGALARLLSTRGVDAECTHRSGQLRDWVQRTDR